MLASPYWSLFFCFLRISSPSWIFQKIPLWVNTGTKKLWSNVFFLIQYAFLLIKFFSKLSLLPFWEFRSCHSFWFGKILAWCSVLWTCVLDAEYFLAYCLCQYTAIRAQRYLASLTIIVFLEIMVDAMQGWFLLYSDWTHPFSSYFF